MTKANRIASPVQIALVTDASMYTVVKDNALDGVLTMDEYQKAAYWVVCPMCDEPKCVDHINCPEIKAWAEKKRKEYGDADD